MLQNAPAKHLYGLDHLRAFAITYVFLYHYQILSKGEPSWLPDFAKFGWTGVDLFFVLSGFLIASQLFAQLKRDGRVDVKTFFIKRVFRILPPYWLIVAIYFCFPLFHEREALPPLWKFITFTQNLGLELSTQGTFSHAWSLCVEEHFYLLLPTVLLLFGYVGYIRKAIWLIPCLMILGFVLRWYSYTHLYQPYAADDYGIIYWYKYIYYPTYNRLDGLLMGVSIASVYVFKQQLWQRISQYGNVLLLLGIAVLVAAYYLCQTPSSFHASVYGFPIVALGYGMVVAGAVSPSSILYRFPSRLTSFIAAISYALYLSHKGIVHLTHYVLADYNIDANLIFVVSTVTSIFAAWLLHTLVDKPMMRLREKWM